MQFTAQQIATLLDGQLYGDPDAKVSRISKIEEAEPDALSFIANPKYEEYLYTSRAGIVLINDTLEVLKPVTATLIKVKDAYSSFALLLEKYNELFSGSQASGIEQPSFVAPDAVIGKGVYIGAFAYIGAKAVIGDGTKIFPGSYIGNGVILGKNCIIDAGVKIYHNCIIGENVALHSGAVVGGDGFGYAPLEDGSFKKIPQIGNVIIEDNVVIGANTTVDRATMGSTIIRKGVKLDNLIMVAHNVEIGENTVIAAQTGISGSAKIGKNCRIGGQVGIVGHIHIADGTLINAQSGVSKSVIQQNTTINGSPAFDYKNSLKSQAIFRNLPQLHTRVQKLEETIAELTAMLRTQSMEYQKMEVMAK